MAWFTRIFIIIIITNLKQTTAKFIFLKIPQFQLDLIICLFLKFHLRWIYIEKLIYQANSSFILAKNNVNSGFLANLQRNYSIN